MGAKVIMDIKVRRKTIGYKHISAGKIEIQDPCYDKNDFGTMTVELPDNEYRMACYIGVLPKEDAGTIFCIELQQKGRHFQLNSPRWEEIGDICVDAGMAGFFWNKPNFSDAEWQKFVDQFDFDKGYKRDQHGFYSSSGYGDGAYGVYAIKENGKIIALKICF